MVAFSYFTDLLQDIAGQALDGRGGKGPGLGLSDLIQQAGIDPATLSGLNESEIVALLAEHGIDVTQYLPEEISQLLGGSGAGEVLTNLIERVRG